MDKFEQEKWKYKLQNFQDQLKYSFLFIKPKFKWNKEKKNKKDQNYFNCERCK